MNNQMPELLSSTVQQILKDKVLKGDIKVNFNGHLGYPLGDVDLSKETNDIWFTRKISKFLFKRFFLLTEEEVTTLHDNLVNGTPLTKNIIFDLPFFTTKCSECGVDLGVMYDGNTIHAYTSQTKQECKYPNGMGEYSIDINIPSGKIVFENDMRPLFPECDNEADNISIETSIGKKSYSELYQHNNLAMLYVGNSSPNIYKLTNNTFMLGQLYNEEDDTELLPSLGNICTDLWWISATDHDDYLTRNGNLNGELSWVKPIVVDVTPGIYRFTSFYHSKLYNPDTDGIYITIRKINL